MGGWRSFGFGRQIVRREPGWREEGPEPRNGPRAGREPAPRRRCRAVVTEGFRPGLRSRSTRRRNRFVVAIGVEFVLTLAALTACGNPDGGGASAAAGGPTPSAPAAADRSSGPACRPSPGQYDAWDGVVPGNASAAIELKPTSGVRRPSPSTKPVPLQIHGRVVDTACRPVAGAYVWAFHRDPDGVYGPEPTAGEDNLFYYEGTVRTDADGRFTMATVRPGGGEGPRHIHVLVAVPRGPLRLSLEVWFADDPQLPPSTNQAVLARPVPHAGGGVDIDVVLVFDPPSTAP
jgi:protocatechuate 3,4-dioxygenase beta subunit